MRRALLACGLVALARASMDTLALPLAGDAAAAFAANVCAEATGPKGFDRPFPYLTWPTSAGAAVALDNVFVSAAGCGTAEVAAEFRGAFYVDFDLDGSFDDVSEGRDVATVACKALDDAAAANCVLTTARAPAAPM